MQRFRYTKYQEQKEYDDYFSLFEKDKEVQRYVSFWKEKSYFIFMDNQFIGIFSLFPFYPQRMEIRRWILPELRNQGLGTEIAKDITDFAFSTFPECHEIISNIHYENKNSQKSIQKAGYILNQNEYEKRQELGEGTEYIPYVKKKTISSF